MVVARGVGAWHGRRCGRDGGAVRGDSTGRRRKARAKGCDDFFFFTTVIFSNCISQPFKKLEEKIRMEGKSVGVGVTMQTIKN